MRFAVKTRPEHQSWKELRDLWIAADQTELAAMAEATSRIRIGCQVTGMIYRHPAVLANIAATVDIISDGRLELGVGAEWNQQETDAYGIDLPPLRSRFDLLGQRADELRRRSRRGGGDLGRLCGGRGRPGHGRLAAAREPGHTRKARRPARSACPARSGRMT